MGRESEYTAQIAALICDQISEGLSLRTICRQEGMPSISTVMKWLTEQPAFSEQYARARESQADALTEEMLDEARQASGLDAAGVQAKRLLIDTLKWRAGKLKPKVYGDKVQTEITGANGGPVENTITVSFVKPK